MKGYYNKRIDRAIKFAVVAHKNQVRKTDKSTPYICHPVSVGFILQNADFDEDVIIAGILHDTIEDTDTKLGEIEENFGQRVRELVESVSENKKLPYEERKQKYLKQVLSGSIGTKAISTADSLHNINSIIDATATGGDEVWGNFTKGKESTINHYITKTKAVFKKWPHEMAKEALDRAIELRRQAGSVS